MNGIILINKQANYTSRDIVNIISKHLQIKKVGHAGTLDPLATGVLVVCVGKATKVVELLTNDDKTYVAEITLGTTTDTLDGEGEVLQQQIAIKSKEEINLVLNSMIGEYYQEVPIYSAVKIKGKKLYEYARENRSVELPKRLVKIKRLELIGDVKHENEKTIFSIVCDVSKGTYIRSLARDIATNLNTIAYMSSLNRIQQGAFTVEDSININDFLEGNYKMRSIAESLKGYNKIMVDDNLKRKIINGQIIKNKYNNEYILFVDSNNQALAIYKTYEENSKQLKPWKMFV